MRMERFERGGVVIIRVIGELRYEQRDAFSMALAEAVSEVDTAVILDMLDVKHFAHDQVHMLVLARKAVSAPNLHLYLVLPPKAKNILAPMQIECWDGLWYTLYCESEKAVAATG